VQVKLFYLTFGHGVVELPPQKNPANKLLGFFKGVGNE
jgi:hypothetical protein